MPELTILPATVYLLVGTLAVLLGVVILRENVRDRVHRTTSILIILVGLKALYEGLVFSFVRSGTAVPSSLASIKSFGFLWEFFFPTLVLFAAIFPTERAVLRRIRGARLILYLPHTFHFLLLLYISSVGSAGIAIPELSARIDYLRLILRIGAHLLNLLIAIQVSLFSLVNIGYVAVAVALFIGSYRRSHNPRLKGQLRIISWGLGSCVGLYTLAEPVPILLGTEFSPVVRQALLVVALTLGAGAIAYSIVRYRFLDTQLLARRSILYAAITAVLVGVYLTLVRELQAFLARVVPGLDVPVIEPVFLVVALVLFQPVLQQLEEVVDRIFLKDRLDHRNILRQLSRDIITILDRRQLTGRIVSTLSEGVMARHPALIDFDAEPGQRVSATDLGADHAAAMEALTDEFMRLPVDEEFMHRDQIAARAGTWGSQAVRLLEKADIYYLLPIQHGGIVHGLLLLGRKVTGVAYTGEEVSLLTTLANQVGVALRNAALYRESLDKAVIEEELALARKIQERLLPDGAPTVYPFEISALNIPSKQVGGDFYDLVDLGDGRVLLAIADVAGKGVPAALLTSMLQASLRTQVTSNQGPAAILRNLNGLTYQFTGPDQFATFFLGVLDAGTCSLLYANAGHNYPFLLRHGGCLESLDQGGLLLGAFPGIDPPECRVTLHGGDRLVLYTDGVTEARPEESEEEYGERRFVEKLSTLRRASAAEMLAAILDDVGEFAGEEQADDITLVIIRVADAAAELEVGPRQSAEAIGVA